MHFLTQSALLQALGWTLVNSLWQMGLLWLAWWLLSGLFHRQPSRFRHGLALGLLGVGALGSMVTFIAKYFFEDVRWGLPAGGSWADGNRVMTTILPYCSSLYLLILGILLVRYWHQYLHSRRLSREGLAKVPAGFRVFVASTSRLMGIRRKVRAWLSTVVDVPMTVGFWKPVILLPAAMISNLSTQQVEAILVHELAHIRRNDYLLNLSITILGLVFFFNPFSRLLIRQLQKEREHCCDDEVLQFRYDPHAYVSALLFLARQHRQGRLALAATGGGDDQVLLQRARKILQQKRTDSRPGARPFILLFLTAAIAALSLSAPRQQQSITVVQPQQPAMVRVTGEMVFIPIVNQGPPVTRRRSATSAIRETHDAGTIIAGPGGENTAADHPGHLSGPNKPGKSRERDEEPSPASLAGAGVRPQGTEWYTQPAALTLSAADADQRDNSLGKGEATDDDAEDAKDLPPMDNLVFVPGSSFSYKLIDTLRPEDKLTVIEEATEKEIRVQVVRLQKELESQLELLRRQEAQAQTAVNASRQQLKKLLNQQVEIQRDYLRKLNELNGRIRKVTRHRTTVYI